MSKEYVVTYQLANAKKRVKELKFFYKHLIVFVVTNSILLLIVKRLVFSIINKESLSDSGFLEWIDWNFYSVPIIWGVLLLIHVAYVFISNPFKKWEERQIQNFVNKDREDAERYTSR